MEEEVSIVAGHTKHLSRWQLFFELRRQGLIRTDWWFLLLKGLPSLTFLWLAELVMGSRGMLDKVQAHSGPNLIASGMALADAYAEASHGENVWAMHSLMLQIYKARVTAFCSVAMSSPTGYGQELGVGFLQEWDRRVEWRLRVKGAHPEQQRDQEEQERTEVQQRNPLRDDSEAESCRRSEGDQGPRAVIDPDPEVGHERNSGRDQG